MSGAVKGGSAFPPPRVDDLLVALSTAGRGEQEVERIKATIDAIATDADITDSFLAGNHEEALRVALAVVMRRRNHALSMADGEGAGERDPLRTALTAAQRHDPAAVARLLPLVPAYGSWRDLRLVGEALLDAAVREGRYAMPGSGATRSVSTPSGSAGGGREELPPEVAAVCAVFAEQLKKDKALLEEQPVPAEDAPAADKQGKGEEKTGSRKRKAARRLPSNAAKYAPHPNRHSGKRKNKKSASGGRDGNDPEDGAGKHLKNPELCCADDAAGKGSDAARLRWLCKRLANGVAERVFGGDSQTLQADYRRLRSALNRQLTEAGHLVEPLLSSRRLLDINFSAAPSGSLKCYSKAIRKNHEAMSKWRLAIANTKHAVPDLDNLFNDVQKWLDEDSVMREFLGLAVDKAVEEATGRWEELRRKEVSYASVMVAVSTSGTTAADGTGRREALLLAALLAARVLGASHIAVDGELVAVPEEGSGLSILGANPSGPEPMEVETEPEASAGGGGGRSPPVPLPAEALEWGAAALSAHYSSFGAGSRAAAVGHDLLFLCLRAPEAEEANLPALVARLQRPMNKGGAGLRSLLLHRMRPTCSCDFRPRLPRGGLPADAGDIAVDVAFVMDLTSSMGEWIDAARAHLVGIMRGLQDYGRVGRINIAFVGYRDYNDRDRLVVQPFVPTERVEEVVAFLKDQHPSGGGDLPEDVISGLQAVAALEWTSHLRFMVFVADAPAHGFCQYGDDFPSGLCPDQDRDLRSWAEELAEGLRVDLLFCRLTNSTDKMEKMLAGVYEGCGGNSGFASLPLESGSMQFRDALLGTLSKSLLRLISPDVDVPGLQTFDGVTVSAVMSTCMSSLRESVADISFRLHGDPYKDMEDREEEQEDASLPDKAAGAKGSRSDLIRLKAELEAEEMGPVRLVLGLPIAGGQPLMAQAAAALLEAGVTVSDMEAKGYPPEVSKAVKEAGRTMLNRL
mmetsp:Transcript_25408/g.71072  ORF Transcript_25408/g.71072 Transcript_25408/m.71072 type:complete len:970 (-) Transcript_25408:237-3146(-)